MNRIRIVTAIDFEISHLLQARALLTDAAGKRRPTRHPTTSSPGNATGLDPAKFDPKPKRRVMSSEGRARIVAAQKKRWAKQKRAKKAKPAAAAKKTGSPRK